MHSNVVAPSIYLCRGLIISEYIDVNFDKINKIIMLVSTGNPLQGFMDALFFQGKALKNKYYVFLIMILDF